MRLHQRTLRQPKLFFAITLVIVISLVIAAIGLDYLDELELSSANDKALDAPTGNISIVVKIPSRTLELYNDGKLYKTYRIAVGKEDTPTPIGDWIVIWKSYRSGDVFGTRFLSLNVPWGGYGIHGTNQPWSIGQFISHGCVRLRNKDVEELFEWVPVGTPVRIEDQRVPVQRTLKYEDSGTDVVQLQVKLKKLGYLEGRADGFFNKDTELALKRFQHDHGFKPTGIATRETLDRLGF